MSHVCNERCTIGTKVECNCCGRYVPIVDGKYLKHSFRRKDLDLCVASGTFYYCHLSD